MSLLGEDGSTALGQQDSHVASVGSDAGARAEPHQRRRVPAGGSADGTDPSRSLAKRSRVQTAAEIDSAALSRRSGECQTASTAARRTALGAAGFRGVTTISGRRGARYQVSAYHGGRQYFIGWFQGEPAFAAWCFDVFVLRLKGPDALPKLNFGSLAVQHLGWDVGSIPAGGDPTFLGEYATTRGRGAGLTMPALPSVDAVTAALPPSNPLRLLVERKARQSEGGDCGAEGTSGTGSSTSDSAGNADAAVHGDRATSSEEGSRGSNGASAELPARDTDTSPTARASGLSDACDDLLSLLGPCGPLPANSGLDGEFPSTSGSEPSHKRRRHRGELPCDAGAEANRAKRPRVADADEHESAHDLPSAESSSSSLPARGPPLGAAGFRGVTTIAGRHGARYQVSVYHGGRQYFIAWFQSEPAFAAWCFDVFALRLKGAGALPKLNFGSLAVQHLGWDVGSIPAGGDPTFLGEYATTRGRGAGLTMPALPSVDAVTAALPPSNPLRLLVERKARQSEGGDGGAESTDSIDAACSSRSSDSAFRPQDVLRGSHEGSAASSSASAACQTDGGDSARGAVAGVATAGVDGGCDVGHPGASSTSSATGKRAAERRLSGVPCMACELPASSSSAGTTLAMHAAGLRSLDGSELCVSTAGGSAAAMMLL